MAFVVVLGVGFGGHHCHGGVAFVTHGGDGVLVGSEGVYHTRVDISPWHVVVDVCRGWVVAVERFGTRHSMNSGILHEARLSPVLVLLVGVLVVHI